MIAEIKKSLYEDKNRLVNILKKLGCHKIDPSFGKNEIRCALPDGNTATSVQIILNEFLPTYVYSRSKYRDYEIKDIITFVRFMLGCNFESAISWLCNELGITYDKSKIILREQSETIKCLKKYKPSIKQNIIKNKPISDSFLNQYPKFIVNDWVKEGISAEIQNRYDIRIDNKRNRWLIPIYDEDNDLVAIKGRTFLPNFKELNIPKYVYYKESENEVYTNNILFGLKYSLDEIKKKNEVIIFEGEKSVMKASEMGFDNCISIGTNSINDSIKPKILSLKSNVVIAFDKGVPRGDIIKECNKLSMFTNVYYIYDTKDLLDIKTKDAPVDKGLKVWEYLYSNKIRLL